MIFFVNFQLNSKFRLDKKLDMLQSTLDDLSLETKIGIDKLLKDEEIITIINSQVSEIITEMQDMIASFRTCFGICFWIANRMLCETHKANRFGMTE